MRTDTGEPRVSPARTPPSHSMTSASIFMRAPAAVALHPAGELVIDRFRAHGQAGGQALDDGDEGGTVGFTGGEEAQVQVLAP